MPKVTYDKETQALNIKIKNGIIADSDMEGNCIFDFNSKGEIINIEVLSFDLEKDFKEI